VLLAFDEAWNKAARSLGDSSSSPQHKQQLKQHKRQPKQPKRQFKQPK
jgi:hypothetical protein